MRWLQEAILAAESNTPRQASYATAACSPPPRCSGGITCNGLISIQGPRETFSRDRAARHPRITVIEFPSQYAADADDYLRKGPRSPRRLATQLIRFALAPHAPYRLNKGASNASAPSPANSNYSIPLATRAGHGCDFGGLIARLESLRTTRPQPHRRPRRPPRRRRHRTTDNPSVRHRPLPTSNMKCSGIAPATATSTQAGVVRAATARVANRLDMLRGSKIQASLLAKLQTGDAAALPAPSPADGHPRRRPRPRARRRNRLDRTRQGCESPHSGSTTRMSNLLPSRIASLCAGPPLPYPTLLGRWITAR